MRGLFPEGLIAEYQDPVGRCSLPFIRQNGKYDWAIPFRDTILYGDELEEIVEQLPQGGVLHFTMQLPFRPAKDEKVRLMVPFSIRTWWIPTQKRAGKDVQYQCECEIVGEEYSSDPVADADLENALLQLRKRLGRVPGSMLFLQIQRL
jgi:hypothetical protein